MRAAALRMAPGHVPLRAGIRIRHPLPGRQRERPQIRIGVSRTAVGEPEQFVQDPGWRLPGGTRVPLGSQGPVTYGGRNVTAEVQDDVGGRVQWRVLPLVTGERPREPVAAVVVALCLMDPPQVAGPQRHPEVRGARLIGPWIHDGLAVKAPGPVQRDALAAEPAAGIALRVEQA
jgi:hypothetical protein